MPVALADALAAVFTEVIVAPAFDEDALAVLSEKKNLRVLSGPAPYGATLDIRSIDGGLLVQEVDTVNLDRSTWRVVTAAQPTESQWADLQFAWQVCAAVSSNAIVYAKDGQAFGIGAGQQNRLDSARIAAERSAGRADGGVCASDAFFPFRDGLEAAAAAGILAVIQPGGSVRDDEVIAAADEHGMAMVFTSSDTSATDARDGAGWPSRPAGSRPDARPAKISDVAAVSRAARLERRDERSRPSRSPRRRHRTTSSARRCPWSADDGDRETGDGQQQRATRRREVCDDLQDGERGGEDGSHHQAGADTVIALRVEPPHQRQQCNRGDHEHPRLAADHVGGAEVE